MTIDEVANYCEFKDCTVSAGDPEAGFVHIDGTGVENRSYTWGRFNMLHEVSSLPSPRKVIEKASVFKIRRGASVRTLTREEFERDLAEFQSKVGS